MTPASSPKHDRRPPYQHAADELRREIKAGRYKPGDQLPPYRELQERFGVANMTARAALNVLRDEGLIYTIQGRGSFVADYEGKGGIDYTPPAWYLGNRAEPVGAEADEIVIGKGKPDSPMAAGTPLTEVLTALRDEIRVLSAEQQELRREVEALKKAQQESSRPPQS
ncbi:GntR family transcriptional regulator [Streptomyces globisporus]|uniref:GntR family transcriptional regulator n=1 Tax=Streptomyces TaxID=1883 RepID=UPI001587161F|nr:GntR family transcriptional regulator [Streptomyces sp. KAI-26]NUV87510.1 GntR family transcriptional regulator [Streptomyces sp. KAI-26]NUW22125.1 GntR family transcriptional regulator [Streptomyces roseoviolaceus]